MGLAIDTPAAKVVNTSGVLTAATFAVGDSGTVRNSQLTDPVYLERITKGGATAGAVRVVSPLLHDNVRGLQYTTAQNPSVHLMGRHAPQVVKPQDTLTVSVSGGATETDVAALSIYYTNLPGSQARLHSWADIASLIAYIKPLTVAVTNSATPGTWQDTAITTTENLLRANTDYAVIGYVTDVAQTLVGLKGAETNNFRVAGPGTLLTEDTSEFFVSWSNDTNRPHIPVFNSANSGSTFVSTMDVVASSTPNVQLLLAMLSQNLST